MHLWKAKLVESVAGGRNSEFSTANALPKNFEFATGFPTTSQSIHSRVFVYYPRHERKSRAKKMATYGVWTLALRPRHRPPVLRAAKRREDYSKAAKTVTTNLRRGTLKFPVFDSRNLFTASSFPKSNLLAKLSAGRPALHGSGGQPRMPGKRRKNRQ